MAKDDREIKLTLKGEDRASQPIRRVGDSVEVTSRKVDKLSGELEEAEAAARDLDGQIDHLNGSMKALAIAIAQTDDADLRKQMEGQLRLQQREQNRLKRLRKTIGEVGDDVDHLGKRSINLLGGSFASLPPQAQAAVAAAGAAIAATLSAAAGAAIAAGIGLGLGGAVIAAGIKAASSSPRVKSAWQAFGMAAKEATRGFGEAFEKPLARAAATFAESITRIANTGAFRDLAATFAPIIDKLAPALAKIAEIAMPSIVNAAKQLAPLFDVLAQHAPKLGIAIAKFFDIIAKSGPGAQAFLDDLLSFLEGLIVVTARVITHFAGMYLAIKEGAAAVKRVVSDAFKGLAAAVLISLGTIIGGAARAFSWVPGIGPKLAAAAKKFWAFAATVNASLDSIDDETVTVRVKVEGKIAGGGSATVGFGPAGKARGGPVRSGEVALVGEEGPELVKFGGAGHVYTARETAAMMGARAGTALPGVGAQTIRVVIAWPDGRVAGEVVARGLDDMHGSSAAHTWMRKTTRTVGGGNVQAAFGR